MKQVASRDWDERFKLVEKDAQITLNDEIRKRLIEAHQNYFRVDGGPRLSSKQKIRRAKLIERLATRLSIELESCGDEMFDCYFDSEGRQYWPKSSDGYVELTRNLNAVVKLARSPGRTARGRTPNIRADVLLYVLRRCYEATGGHVAFLDNKEGRRVSGPYPDYLRAIRRHVFQNKVLQSDEAFIDRARKARSFNRHEHVRLLCSKLRSRFKAMIFWAGPEWTKQFLEREIEAMEAPPRLLSRVLRQQLALCILESATANAAMPISIME
jgi:hypothetical protein